MRNSTILQKFQRELQMEVFDFGTIHREILKTCEARKKYTIQLGENELVLKELALLTEDVIVYKLIGPVLVKQELAEANAKVRSRMDYIFAQLKLLDKVLRKLEERKNSKSDAISKVERMIQFLQAEEEKHSMFFSPVRLS